MCQKIKRGEKALRWAAPIDAVDVEAVKLLHGATEGDVGGTGGDESGGVLHSCCMLSGSSKPCATVVTPKDVHHGRRSRLVCRI